MKIGPDTPLHMVKIPFEIYFQTVDSSKPQVLSQNRSFSKMVSEFFKKQVYKTVSDGLQTFEKNTYVIRGDIHLLTLPFKVKDECSREKTEYLDLIYATDNLRSKVLEGEKKAAFTTLEDPDSTTTTNLTYGELDSQIQTHVTHMVEFFTSQNTPTIRED